MRKVFYNVEGTIFTSYTQATQFRDEIEDLEDRSVDLKTILEDVAIPNEKAEAHRAKVEEVLAKGGVQ